MAVYIIPGGYIYALSSQAVSRYSGLVFEQCTSSDKLSQLTVNIIAEIIPSYLFRGQPIVNMVSFVTQTRKRAYIDWQNHTAVQSLHGQYFAIGFVLYSRSQAWSLHEDPAPSDIFW